MPSNPVAPVPQPPTIVAALSQHRVAVSSDSSLASLAVSFRASVQIAMSSSFALQPPSTFSASVAAPASLCCTPPRDHLLPFITASLPAAHPPSVTLPALAASRALYQPNCLSSSARAAAADPIANARRCSFAPPASPSGSYAALGNVAAVHVSKKGERDDSGAVCADNAPSLGSRPSAAACIRPQVQPQHGGGAKPLQQRKIVQRVCCNTLKHPPLLPQLQPQPLRHEDWAPRPCSSGKRFWTDAVAVALLLCLSCIANVAAAQLEACPGAWSTAALSVNRQRFAATSLPNQGLAIFAGGIGGLSGL